MALLNPNPANRITCDSLSSSSNLKYLKFSDYGLSVVQGANTLFHLAMEAFFAPVEQYQYGEFTLEASTSAALDPGNISNANGEVTGIIVVVDYPAQDTGGANLTEAEKYIQYSYSGGSDMNIGKLLVLTGTQTAGRGWNLIGSPGGITIENPHADFDVTLKVLLIS